MTNYGIAMNPAHVAELLFGESFEVLSEVPAERLGDILVDYDSDLIGQLDVLVTGWGAPPVTAEVLARAPRLRAIVHAGGAATHLLPEPGARSIDVSTAALANAIPVAEYTLAMILLANKQAFHAAALYRERRDHIDRELTFPTAGNYRRTVGVVSASRIGRRVIALLAPFDLEVIVYDPYLTAEEATGLGVQRVQLDDLMRRADVVTLHTPVLPETVGLIGRSQLAALRDGATLINTARGAIVDQEAMTAELESGRIGAILDVTEPDPLEPSSPLYDLPNVMLTPHIAGSMGVEIRRLGEQVAAELTRVARGEPMLFLEP